MEGGRAQPGKSIPMSSAGISLVLRNAISRKPSIQIEHETITVHLCEDACSGNRVACCITVYERLLTALPLNCVTAVDEQVVRAGH